MDPANHRAEVLERQGEWARVRVSRYGDGGAVILVGWLLGSRLLSGVSGGGLGSLSGGFTPEDLDREECETTSTLPIYVEGEGRRVLAGEVDAGAQLRVDARDGDWAQVRPLGHDLTVAERARFVVQSAGLHCSLRRGTHLQETHRVQVNADGLSCGAVCECELRLARPREGEGNCHARLQCGSEVLFGGETYSGQFVCNVVDGRVTGADPQPSLSASEGDPRFSFAGDTLTASDEVVGRLGAFRLEGRILPTR